jgi:hypothetical protein
MFIQDLNHLEVVSEEANINGGIAIAVSNAQGYARGPNFAGTATSTSTYAVQKPGFFWFPGLSTAGSKSSSVSAAF